MTYTAIALVVALVVILAEVFWLKTGLFKRSSFYFAYLIVLFFQLLTNGYLTFNEIVLYNPEMILGLRVAFAPIEDLLFGFSLVVLTQLMWLKSEPRR